MKLIRKLKSKKGETFVELLIAILIVAFGCLLIATMYSTAFNLNVKASEEDTKFYGAITEMEQMIGDSSGTTENGKAVIKDKDDSSKSYEVNVDTYGDDTNNAYRKENS